MFFFSSYFSLLLGLLVISEISSISFLLQIESVETEDVSDFLGEVDSSKHLAASFIDEMDCKGPGYVKGKKMLEILSFDEVIEDDMDTREGGEDRSRVDHQRDMGGRDMEISGVERRNEHRDMERDKIRDIERDKLRDIERDQIRDRLRDMNRDTIRDKVRDEKRDGAIEVNGDGGGGVVISPAATGDPVSVLTVRTVLETFKRLGSISTPEINFKLAIPFEKRQVKESSKFKEEYLEVKSQLRKVSGGLGKEKYHEEKERRKSLPFPWPQSPHEQGL